METVELPLTRGKVALIDKQDLEPVAAYRWDEWQIHRCWYAAARNQEPRIYLHRFILNAPQGMEVDHLNGDGLDNRRANLRLASHKQNLANQQLSLANTSGYRGVVKARTSGIWAAQIKSDFKTTGLGYYDSKETAAYAYDLAALDLFGAFARFNLLTAGSDIAAIRERVKAERRVRQFKPENFGPLHPKPTKLNPDAVRTIRALYAAKAATKAQLARQFDVHIQTIIPVLNGETWKHVS